MKKTMTIAAIAICAAPLCSSEVRSYVNTLTTYGMGSVRKAIPVAADIEHARVLVEQMSADINASLQTVGEESANVAKLNGQVLLAEELLGKQEHQVRKLRDMLANNDGTPVVFDRRRYTKSDLERLLKNTFLQFESTELRLATLQRTKAACQTNLQTAREQLADLSTTKDRLTAELEELRSRWMVAEAKHQPHPWSTDRQGNDQAEKILERLEDKVAKLEHVLTAEQELVGTSPLLGQPENILDVVNRRLGKQRTPETQQASK